MVDYFQIPFNPTYFFILHHGALPLPFISYSLRFRCIWYCQVPLTHTLPPCLLLILTSITTMLISDIRMKSRGASLPNSQSAASRLAQQTDQRPGITGLMSTSPSFIVMTCTSSVNLSCVHFDRITWLRVLFLLSFRVIKP